MLNKYPKHLEKADNSERVIEKRFFNASIGWIRYKPLLMYISDKEHYQENIKKVYKNLESCIPAMNKIFQIYDFSILLEELVKYSVAAVFFVVFFGVYFYAIDLLISLIRSAF